MLRHVAIIMDGNGRWAAQRGLPRGEGHRAGVEAVRRVVRAAGELGIEYLTLYSFSSENWSRPKAEIADLFGLLRRFIRTDLARLHEAGVRIKVIGARDGVDADICSIIDEAERLTAGNAKLNLNIAFNYGSRGEIVRAARALAARVAAGEIGPDDIDEAAFSAGLDTAGVPDPDVILRTSGEQRLSNFLLWQGAYSELVFVPVLWPDFAREHLEDAISEFAGRDRRFGGVVARTGS